MIRTRHIGSPLAARNQAQRKRNRFLEGRQILVTSVQKLFNGLTKFKLAAQSHSVGAIVMDDCHACADTIRKQCVIELPNTHRTYSALLSLFAEDLKEQGAGTFADIREQRFDAFLPVPYWSWMDHHEDVAAILAKDNATNEIKYAWPLLRDILRDSVCVVSGHAIEISSRHSSHHFTSSVRTQGQAIVCSCLRPSPMMPFWLKDSVLAQR